MVKSLQTSGQDNDNNKAPWSALHLCWVLCTQHPRVLWSMLYSGDLSLRQFGDKVQSWVWTQVLWTPKSQDLLPTSPSNLQFPLSLGNMTKMSPSLQVSWCNYAVLQPPALGAGNAWKAVGLQNHSLFLPKDSFQARRKFCVRPFTSRKAGLRDLMLFLCIGSFREKKVLLAPKAHLDYLESQ